jgi:hypothetical protein
MMRQLIPVERPKQGDTLALGVRGSAAALLGDRRGLSC